MLLHPDRLLDLLSHILSLPIHYVDYDNSLHVAISSLTPLKSKYPNSTNIANQVYQTPSHATITLY